MKTVAELFEVVIKSGFQRVLKPLGFKKKGNSFYLFKNGIGHIISVQKSTSNTKDNIRFIINTGIFLPEYWMATYNYFNKPVPNFPNEAECILRMRIAQLKNESEKWIQIDQTSDPVQIANEMQENLTQFVLPHFNRAITKEMLVKLVEELAQPLEKIIVFGELNEIEMAKKEYSALLNAPRISPAFLPTLNEYGRKYGLV